MFYTALEKSKKFKEKYAKLLTDMLRFKFELLPATAWLKLDENGQLAVDISDLVTVASNWLTMADLGEVPLREIVSAVFKDLNAEKKLPNNVYFFIDGKIIHLMVSDNAVDINE